MEQKKQAVELYETGISGPRVASIFGVDKSTVMEWLEDKERHHQKKNCNHFAFHPDEHGAYTPAQKYWAGVLMADGCVMGGKRTPSVKLSMIDQEHVFKFKQFLGAEHDVCRENPRTFKFDGKKYTGKPMHSIRVTSNQMVEDLRRLGVSPRKTYGASCPDFLKLDRDFWRGIADGDGWLSFDTKTLRPEVGVCGTPELCQAFAECINHICGGRDISAKWQAGRGLLFSRARASGEKAKTMAEWLYKDSVTSLDRKMLKAQRMYEAAPIFTQTELML
jgi:hypothetical protein